MRPKSGAELNAFIADALRGKSQVIAEFACDEDCLGNWRLVGPARRYHRLGNLGMAANGWDRDGVSWLAGHDPWHRVHNNSGMLIDGPNVL